VLVRPAHAAVFVEAAGEQTAGVVWDRHVRSMVEVRALSGRCVETLTPIRLVMADAPADASSQTRRSMGIQQIPKPLSPAAAAPAVAEPVGTSRQP
jgi:hypothetical protein